MAASKTPKTDMTYVTVSFTKEDYEKLARAADLSPLANVTQFLEVAGLTVANETLASFAKWQEEQERVMHDRDE